MATQIAVFIFGSLCGWFAYKFFCPSFSDEILLTKNAVQEFEAAISDIEKAFGR